MSALKNTRCEPYCRFTKVTSYCFDCPAVICSYCKSVMHNDKLRTKDHNILEFKNDNLNWKDKPTILDIFDDKNLGEIVYGEVSRNLDIENIPDVIDYSENVDSWQCKKCTTFNLKFLKKCQTCYHINIPENDYVDCDIKLKKFKLEKLQHFIDFDNAHSDNYDINFEYIMQYYTSDDLNAELIIDWLMTSFSNEKTAAIMKKILKKNNRISINELDQEYINLVQEENKNLINTIKSTTNQIHLAETSGLLEPENINKKNKTPELSPDRITEEKVWKVIFDESLHSPRIMRLLMVELDLDSYLRVEILQFFINDQSLGVYLKESSKSGNVNLSHVKQAICDQVSIEGASYFLINSCELCDDNYPMPEMCQFIICQHEFCKLCVFSWLEHAVESSYPCNWTCPRCTSEKYKEIDKNMHYSQLRNILSTDSKLLHIFEEKLLQEQLMTSKNFHWCPIEECTYGFESEGEIKIQCPSCKSFLCANCGRKWHDEHAGKTCVEFEMWMLKNDPNLSKLLQNIGIDCPHCGMRYAMAAGGCLHFDCKACKSPFCGGCDQIFVKKCDKPNCEMTNFHLHHPRNCIYYLRDNNVNVFEQMLKNFDYPKLQGKPEKQCQFMITTEKFKDVPCNKEVYQTTGFCESHYKEYLVQFINRYKIDPADFADIKALNMMLIQMALPEQKKLPTENDNQFKERLIKIVKETCLFYIPKGATDPV